MQTGSVESRRAMVTGGGAGIGLATARALGRSNCRLFVVDVNADTVTQTLAMLRSEGCESDGLVASVAEPDQVTAAFTAMDASFGGIDILVNNAGVTGNCAADALDLAAWNRIIGVNQTGTFLCAQAAGVRMQSAGGGCIVNLSSIYGLVAAPNRVAYSATKAAVIMMTKVLAVEWASVGIRVNCVAPGYVETPGTEELVQKGTIDLQALRMRTPQHRLAQPEDIANAIVMMCDEKLAHVTGQVLAVDGGWSTYGYL
jgi:NAD(P)-dependent dehydrogenase (short-subunit alcohol dehydrogenase family)